MSASPAPTLDAPRDPALAACPLALSAQRFWSLTLILRLALHFRDMRAVEAALIRLAAEVAEPTLPEPFASRLVARWPSLKAETDALLFGTPR